MRPWLFHFALALPLIPSVALAQTVAIRAGKLVDPDRGVTLADQVGTDFPEVAIKEMGFPPPMYERILSRLKLAVTAGVTMAFGSDIFFAPPGYTRGSLAASFVDVYKEAGVPARDLVRMMTTNAARLLGVEKQRGAIRPGLAADIIATDGNPLDDAAALKKVVFVMKDGKVVRK